MLEAKRNSSGWPNFERISKRPYVVAPVERGHGAIAIVNSARMQPSVIRVSRLPVILLTATGLLACETKDGSDLEWRIVDQSEAQRVCGRSNPRTMQSDAVMVLTETEKFPCEIVAVRAGVLRPALDGSHPDPGEFAVRASSGRVYTTADALNTVILAWHEDGTFMKVHDRLGLGPGEIAGPGLISLFMGPGDSLLVRDSRDRWSVFGPDLEFGRTFTGTFAGRSPAAVHITRDGRVLTTGSVVGGTTGDSFHLMDLEGRPIRSFHRIEDTPGWFKGARLSRERSSALATDSSFWAAPNDGAPSGIVLQEWSFNGKHLRTIERRAHWIPSQGYSVTTDASGHLLPEYDQLHVDHEGLIWLAVAVRDRRWRPRGSTRRRLPINEMYDTRIEVIDPAAGAVLASFLYDGPGQEVPPFARLFPGMR